MDEALFPGRCGHEFRLKGKTKRLLERVRRGNMPLAMIECPICQISTAVEAPHRQIGFIEEFRCPEKACCGWVCKVTEGETFFYGCGECGSVWTGSDSLFEAISTVVKQKDYRRKVYLRTAEGWKPVSPEKEPRNYEALVEREWD